MQNDVIISKKGVLSSDSATTIYTVPSGRIMILVDWFLNNNTGTNISNADVSIGGVPMFPGKTMPAYSKYFESKRHIELVAGDTITVKGKGVAYYFSGIEQDESPN